MCMQIPKNIKKSDEDITDDEWDNLHVPNEDNLNNFMVKYVVPEVVAFQLANSYYRGCLCSATFLQHYNSMNDIILVYPSLDEVKEPIVELLKIKYNLKVVNESPLILDKWE